MRNKRDEKFFSKLSRKELQGFCKKYGLPARKSSSEMARSLASYFQDTSNSPFTSQCDRSNFNSKECPTTNLCENCSGIVRDGRVQDICRIQHTNVNLCHCSRENSLSSSSFEFYVHSEEGIKLCVDLSSSPSDWIKKLKSEVNICESISHNKAPSFHQALGRLGESNKQNKSSFLLNIDAHQSEDGNMQSESSPSLVMNENKHEMLNHPDGGDGSLTSIAIKPSGIAVVLSEHVLEDQGVVSSEPNSDARDGIHSCTDENGRVTTLESDVNTPSKELAGNSIVDTSDCPISLASIEHEKPSNENCDSTQENSCNLVISQLAIAGCTASSSGEVPLSEAEIQHNGLCIAPKNGEFLDSVYPTGNTEPEQSGLTNSSELDLGVCGNHLPTTTEELERSKLIDGVECSESLKCDNSFEKTCSSLDNMESDRELLKKRPCMENNDQPDNGRPDAKILRSIKNFAVKVLPRRSMRLVSKVATFFEEQLQ